MNIYTSTESSVNTIMANARFQKIVDDDLCIGCGLCEAVAGSNKINMQKDQQGELRPVVLQPLSEGLVDKIYDVCPSTRVDGLPDTLCEEAPKHDLVWGPYHDMQEAWAGDSEVRFEGSTGGGLTALAMYLLDSEQVDFIYHVKSHDAEPTFGQGTISRNQQQVLAAAGSRYGPTAMLKDIEAVLERNQPFAFIGKPCDISALRNLARHDKRINRLVRYWLTPVCGGYMPDQSMQKILDKSNIERDSITHFRYRGRGCPGPTSAKLQNGNRKDWTYFDFWGEDESDWSLPFRCKVCPDGIGDSADIAAADTWPGGGPVRELIDSDPGTNSLIIRTETGLRLVRAAQEAGYLELGKKVGPEYMNQTQPHQVAKKKNVAARYAGLSKAGRLVPHTNNLRLERLGRTLGKADYQKQKQGAYDRAAPNRTG